MRPNLIAYPTAIAFAFIGTAHAQSAVSAVPAIGHPGQVVTVAGTKFGASEAVDLYVDTTDTVLCVTSATGAFSVPVTLPAGAAPGGHTITAIGRHSGDAAQKSVTVSTSWFEHGFGAAHLGLNPYENVLSPATVPSLGLQWTSSIVTEGATPAISAGRIYVAGQSGVSAISPASGSAQWTKLTSSGFVSSPAISGGAVYVGSLDGTMYALNAITGVTLWSHTIGKALYSSPVVVGGVIYVGCDNSMFALQAGTGAILWTYTTGAIVDGSAAIVNGVLYFGSRDDDFYALNARDGSLRWQVITTGLVESTPAVANNIVYFGSGNGYVSATDTEGKQLWYYTTGGPVTSNPAVANGIVYIGSEDGLMYAFNAHSGQLLWTVSTGGAVRSASVANGVLYFTSLDGLLYVVNALSGVVLAAAHTNPTYFGAPVIADGVVYVPAYNEGLHAFTPNGGTNTRPPKAPNPRALHPDLKLAITYE